jgi:polysaccharide chain length determinant protein (PEP-CTERM system associated)
VLPGKSWTPEDLLRVLRRRWFVILVPLMLFSAGAYVWARILPEKFRSETVILIVPQRVPESYVRSTVTARIEDRLSSISQQILSRTRLERVIQDFDLYKAERQVRLMEDVVSRMRNEIFVEVVRGDAFKVAFSGDDPRTVMRVTDRLAALFIEENMRDRELVAEGTNQFLEAQLEDAKRRLLDNERRLVEYKRQNSAELPTQVQSNLQAVLNVNMQIQAIVESVNRDRDRKLAAQRQLADLDLPSEQAPPPPVIGPAAPPATGNDTPVGGSLAELLMNAERALQGLELRLTAEHPDVVRQKRYIAELKARLAGLPPVTPTMPDEGNELTIAQLARRNRRAELEAELRNLEKQIATKQAEEERLRALAAEYQARIDAAPRRESELTELTRDYGTLQNIYTDLLGKREDSKIAANLERRQIGEQFKILDPAGLPEKPYSPDRRLINVVGAALGLVFGIGFVSLLEYRDNSFRTQEDVVNVLALPVLAQIPVMKSGADRRAARRRIIGLSTAALVVVAGAVAAWKYGALNALLH